MHLGFNSFCARQTHPTKQTARHSSTKIARPMCHPYPTPPHPAHPATKTTHQFTNATSPASGHQGKSLPTTGRGHDNYPPAMLMSMLLTRQRLHRTSNIPPQAAAFSINLVEHVQHVLPAASGPGPSRICNILTNLLAWCAVQHFPLCSQAMAHWWWLWWVNG